LIITAEDADAGANAEVRYKLVEGAGNFSIDSLTGEIR